MTKHTPGPWTHVGFGVVQPLSPQANGHKITTQCFGPDSEANARLIATAPDMAQTIRDLLALHIAHHNHPHHARAREILRAIDGA